LASGAAEDQGTLARTPTTVRSPLAPAGPSAIDGESTHPGGVQTTQSSVTACACVQDLHALRSTASRR
jgi:hypothetical protein